MNRLLKLLAPTLIILIGLTEAAQAGPLAAAVVWVASEIGITVTAAAVTTSLITTALATGLSYIAQALRGGSASQQFGIKTTLQSGGIVPRSFIVGTYCTPGSEYYPARTWGKSGKTPNAYFTRFIALSDTPCSGLLSIIVNDQQCTYGSGSPDANLGYAIPEFNTGGLFGTPHLWVKFLDGSQESADGWAVSQFGSDPDYPYTSDMVGKGVALVMVTALIEPTLFSGLPEYKFEIRGAALYDPTQDGSVGGSGSQRFNDQSTWVYSENAAVVKYNVLRGISWGGQWLYGLQNSAAGRLPLDNWFAAINVDAAEVEIRPGVTTAQFRCGGEVVVTTAPADLLDELNKCDNGRLIETGGLFKTRSGAIGSAAMSFNVRDLIVTEAQSEDPFPGLEDTVNGIAATYPEPAENWVMKDAPARYNADWEAADRGRRIADVAYNFCPFGDQVQLLMKSAADEGRKFRKFSASAPPIAVLLDATDAIALTDPGRGFTNKLFTVVPTDEDSVDQGLALQEVDPADYDFNPETDYRPYTTVPIVSRDVPSQPMAEWSVEPIAIFGDDDKAKPGIQVSWSTDDIDDVDGVIIEIRLTSSGAIVWAGETPHSIEQFQIGSFIPAADLLGNTAYQARGKFRPMSTRDTDWSDWLDVTTLDIRLSALEIYDKAISRAKLDDGLQSLNDFLGQSARDLIDQLAQVSQSVAETGLGTSTDIQVLRRGLKSNYDQITAEYSEVILVATGPDSAIVQSIETLSASIGGFASATDLFALTARVDDAEGDISANAEAILGLDATVGNVSASGLFRVTVEATPSGYDSRIGLSASGTSGGATSAASIYIDAKSGSPSRIMLVADQVSILDGSDSAALSDAFLFDSGTLYLKNATIVNLTVDNLEYGAATNMHSATGGSATISDGNWHTVATSSLSTIGGRVLLIAQAQFNTAKTGSPFWDYGSWQLLMDGNLVQDGSNYAIGKYAVPTSDIIGLNYAPNTFMFAFTPAAGSHSFALQVNRQGSSTISVISGFMQSLESRR